jgi:hypothetical protein
MAELIKHSLDTLLDVFWLGAATTATWGSAGALGGAALFWD